MEALAQRIAALSGDDREAVLARVRHLTRGRPGRPKDAKTHYDGGLLNTMVSELALADAQWPGWPEGEWRKRGMTLTEAARRAYRASFNGGTGSVDERMPGAGPNVPYSEVCGPAGGDNREDRAVERLVKLYRKREAVLAPFRAEIAEQARLPARRLGNSRTPEGFRVIGRDLLPEDLPRSRRRT
jgi:hypothetical protein